MKHLLLLLAAALALASCKTAADPLTAAIERRCAEMMLKQSNPSPAQP